MKLGLIGNGAIAKIINSYCEDNCNNFTIVGALGEENDLQSVGRYPLFTNIDNLINQNPEVIIECASKDAVCLYSRSVLLSKINLIIISVAALVNDDLYKDLVSISKKVSSKFIIPTGALAGLDAIEAAKIDGLQTVSLKTTKPPNSWKGAPGVGDVNLDIITSPKVLFDGNAREASRLFPKNANVAAALGISGIGLDETNVQLVADPNITNNYHRLIAKGSFGDLDIVINAVPSEDNPKTSQLAALSIIRELNNLV